ncbi:DoxX family membrane protein [Flavobacterium sp. '19STA2R22 D10 B1']|uniref:DoxX family membrane protein n=1 Tax=Flavobacterium aerium TaxID=3037261 RepID=UPI00278C378E|nr:DoxX family membrane protein [Flavobacterium sp. '19STA2R22 D10 B1']
MESKYLSASQLFLRIALSISFLSAVADRFGMWGMPGSPGVNWGNWQNFVQYSNTLNAFASPQIGNFLAIFATVLEIVLPLLLLVGYKLKITAFIAGCLLASFGLVMTLSIGIKPSLDYSVWTSAAACFLLSVLQNHTFIIKGE